MDQNTIIYFREVLAAIYAKKPRHWIHNRQRSEMREVLELLREQMPGQDIWLRESLTVKACVFEFGSRNLPRKDLEILAKESLAEIENKFDK